MKVRTSVREKVSTECHKHAATLPSSSGSLALVFSSYVLGNGCGGGEEGREGGRHGVAVTVRPGLDEQVLSGAQTRPHSPLCVSLPVLDHEMLGGE